MIVFLALAATLAEGLLPGTPVALMVLNEVTTKTARPGDRFAVSVVEPLSVNGTVVVPINTRGWGEVVSARESGIVGQSGKLAAKLLWLDIDGERVKLAGDFAPAGQGAGIQTALFSLVVSPLGLLARGNNAKLKAGERITGVLAAGYTPKPEVVAPASPPR